MREGKRGGEVAGCIEVIRGAEQSKGARSRARCRGPEEIFLYHYKLYISLYYLKELSRHAGALSKQTKP